MGTRAKPTWIRRVASVSKSWLRDRRGVRTQARLTIEPPQRTTSGWLLRLRVRNHGRPATFEAQVVAVTPAASPSPADGPPWDLGWRHHDGTNQVRLGHGETELVRLAVARTDRPQADLLLLRADAWHRSHRIGAARPDQRVLATVRLRHAETGKIVTEQCVEISFSDNAGEIVPSLSFVRAGTPPIRREPPAIEAETRRPEVEAPAVEAEARRPEVEARKLSADDKQSLADILRCSECGARYEVSDTELVCSGCQTRLPVVDGIPVLTKATTIPTMLDKTDYETLVDEQTVVAIGRQWKDVIAGLGLEPEHALEIGSGTGALTLGLLRERAVGRLTGSDVSLKFLRALAPNAAHLPTPVSFVACDANEAHFRAEAFDLVVGRSVLHHLLDYDVTLRQCATMLKPGGAAVFFEPVLEGKIFMTLLMALVLRSDEMSDDPQLSATDCRKIRGTMAHHMKAKLWPQDRESLSRLEDKYIFVIDQLTEVGRQVGFSSVEFLNNGEAKPDLWPTLAWNFKVTGVAPEKITRYRWIGEEFANTYGLMFSHKLVTPMGFFVFHKAGTRAAS